MASRGQNYVSKRLPCKGGGDPREGGVGGAVAVIKERAGDSDGAMAGVRVRYALKVVPAGSICLKKKCLNKKGDDAVSLPCRREDARTADSITTSP